MLEMTVIALFSTHPAFAQHYAWHTAFSIPSGRFLSEDKSSACFDCMLYYSTGVQYRGGTRLISVFGLGVISISSSRYGRSEVFGSVEACGADELF